MKCPHCGQEKCNCRYVLSKLILSKPVTIAHDTIVPVAVCREGVGSGKVEIARLHRERQGVK